MLEETLAHVVRAQLQMAKDSLRTAHLALDTVERIMALSVPDAPPASTTVAPKEERDDAGVVPTGAVTPEQCEHPKPRRMGSAVMGKPNRFFCTECGEHINPDEEK